MRFRTVLVQYDELGNEVFLRVTNHAGQAEKNLLGPAGIRTRDLRFTSPILYLDSILYELGSNTDPCCPLAIFRSDIDRIHALMHI